MKVTYDPEADAMYIYLLPNKKSTRTEEIREDVLLDFAGKEMIGIEILAVSEKLSKKNLNKLSEHPEKYSQIVFHTLKSSK